MSSTPAEGGVAAPRRRRGTLSRSGDFEAVYQRGISAAGRHLVVYGFDRGDASREPDARLGLSVSRKVGDAVTRNRIKRVLREQFSQLQPSPPASFDVVVIARPGCARYLEAQGSDALGARLGELMEKVTKGASA